MTEYSEATINDAILDSGGVNQITIYCEKIDVTRNKILTIVKTPSTGTIKETKVLDLLRSEKRITINGFINSADKTKLSNIFETKGPTNLNYDGTTDKVNIERYSLSKDASGQDERQLMITFVVGADLTG
jgi:hypothetical protein